MRYHDDLGVFGEPVDTDLYIYHYTSLKVALEYILRDGVIRLSPLKSVNDPKESKWAFYSNDITHTIGDRVWLEFFDVFRSYSKILCCCCDVQRSYEEQANDEILYRGRGFNHPRMWAQYADNHHGVCLVFDRNELIKESESEFSGKSMYSGRVEYGDTLFLEEDDALSYTVDVKMLVEKGPYEAAIELMDRNHRLYYFRKLRDWRDEVEYRIVLLDDNEDYRYISIRTALKGIIAGFQFPDVYRPTVESLLQEYYDVSIGRMNWHHGVAQLMDPL